MCVCVCVCVARERDYKAYKHDVSGTLSWSKVIYFLIFVVRMKSIYLTLPCCCSLQIGWFAIIAVDISDFMYSCTYFCTFYCYSVDLHCLYRYEN